MTKRTHLPGAFLILTVFLLQACEGGGEAAESDASAQAPSIGAPAAPASVSILSPTEGEVVTGPNVTVRLDAAGVTIVPAANHDAGTGHHHIFIDRDPTPLTDTIPVGVPDVRHLGQGQTEFTIEGLTPGEHRLIAVIGWWDHIPLSPPLMDTVRFTVAAPTPELD